MHGKWIALGVGVLVAGYVALGAYAVSRQNIESLLVCADRGGLQLPLAKQWCRAWLFGFRGSPGDIAALHQGVGASFVVQGEAPLAERAEVLEFLVARGLDPNRIDMHGATPLHAAVLAGALDEARLLLAHGAHTDVKAMPQQITALQLARQLQRSRPSDPGRMEMVQLLARYDAVVP